MYTKEQIETALNEFEHLGSVQAVINLLGYPSRNTLYRWYEDRLAGKPNYHGSLNKQYNVKEKFINTSEHPHHPDTNIKLDAIKRCFSYGEGVEYVSREIGYSRIYRELKKIGIVVSEKVVRRIMKSEGLIVKVKRTKKYSSYKGEISLEVDNIINRDFHAESPNTKWLTDITELQVKSIFHRL